MNIVYLLLTSVLFAWLYWLWTRRKFYSMIFKIPGPLGFPIFGMAPYMMRREDILKIFDKFSEKYGSVLFSWLGPYPFVVVSEPNIAQEILNSPSCINKSIVYKSLDNGTGHGLFSLKDPDWSVHRKHLNPAFNHKVLLTFFPIFNEEVNSLLKIFEDWANTNEPIDLLKTFKDFTLNVSIRTTMGKSETDMVPGTKCNLLKSYHCYVVVLKKANSIVDNMTEMIFKPWLCNNFYRKLIGIYEPFEDAKTHVRQFIRKLIAQNMSSESTDNQPRDQKQLFIYTAIELLRRGVFSWQEVEDESNVIVIGAFETTAITIYHTLILMAIFPEYQRRVYEELLTIFPDGGEFEVSYSDIQDMVYMDMVLNETMRVLTPVPVVARETSTEVKLSNGIVIPAGVQVAIYIHRIHRRTDIWGPDAQIFNPDNFLPSNTETRHPYAYLPFTKGKRNCIGWKYGLLSVKVTLAKLLRNFKFSTDFQYKDMEFIEDIVLKLKQTPILNIAKRNPVKK